MSLLRVNSFEDKSTVQAAGAEIYFLEHAFPSGFQGNPRV